MATYPKFKLNTITKLSLAALLLGVFAFAPREDGTLDKLLNALQKWSDTTTHEKVYLHTDRPYYAIGDTVWLKAYVTVGSQHQLSAKSGALYVELVNSADSVAQLLKLPVISGMAKGNFVLSKSYIEGNYRLRAYTQWLRNAGPEYFYDKVLLVKDPPLQNVFTNINYKYGKAGDKKYLTAVLNYTDSTGLPLRNINVKFNVRKNYNTIYNGEGPTDVKGNLTIDLRDLTDKQLKASSIITRVDLPGSGVVVKSFPIKSLAMQADLQFFPEGGNMIEGYAGRVAFKAIGTDGLGVDVKGVVTDDLHDTITTFTSRHLGMGYFNLQPKSNRVYQASITYPDGSKNMVKLPAANPYGYTMTVYPNVIKDSVLLRINGAIPTSGNSQTVHLIMQSGGEVYYSATVILNKGFNSLHVPTKDLPSGIAQFTLFSATGAPMNERIIFIDNNDRLNLDVKSDRNIYTRRQKASFDIDAKSPDGKSAIGSFSVSVINEDDVPLDDDKGGSILSQLLLSSDIKGYIEKPNYYFNHPETAVKDELDLLMLTQGYRRFSWNDLLVNKPYNLKYTAEGLTTNISGHLLGLWGRKIPNGKIYIMNNKLGILLDTVTDKEGRFNFDKLVITDGLRFSVSGRRKNDANNVHLFLDKYAPQKMTANLNMGDITTDFRKVVRPELNNLSKEDEDKLLRDLTKNTLLKQVNIKSNAEPGRGSVKGKISQSIIFDETDAGKTIAQAITDRKLEDIKLKKETYDIIIRGDDYELPRTVTMNTYGAYLKKQTAMSIFINDRIFNRDEIFDVFNWNVEDAIKLDISRVSDKYNKPAMLLYTSTEYVPVRTGNPRARDIVAELVWDVTNIIPKGFNNAEEFYQPKYTTVNTNSRATDLRATIYWNPSVITRDGHASFSFYNNDKPGNYKVVVEGIDADGELGRQVYRYKVGTNL